jgi:NAD(P)-dependent dehydrogenase (short-subunit alcohol dehydrogenase family)
MVSGTEERDAGSRPVLVTGATGYVGGRLLRSLEERGLRVRCLARNPANLASRVAEGTEVVEGDAVSGEGLGEALLSKRPIGTRPSISGPRRARRESGASSTWAGSRTRVRSFRRTCEVGSKSGACYENPVFR